jgi:hypothetical protein
MKMARWWGGRRMASAKCRMPRFQCLWHSAFNIDEQAVLFSSLLVQKTGPDPKIGTGETDYRTIGAVMSAVISAAESARL